MNNLSDLLTPTQVQLTDLLLDPNNPRFSELGEALHAIPEARFAEPRVQANTFEKMKDPTFDVAELRDTIKTIGFLPMDRIVVRKWKGSSTTEKFVVVEGNRRVTALKWLLDLHDAAKETLASDRLLNINTLECLVLDTDRAPASAALILPGLRHVSGVKEWGPYQKAKAVHALRTSGLTAQDAAQSLGLSTRAANAAFRCFLALEQMKSDDEFGDYAEPKMYSFFEEVFKRPGVREWLDWSDERGCFIQETNLREFYSWMTPSEESPSPKLAEARSVRELGDILKDENALNVLRSPEGTLSRALARYEIDHPADWYPKVVAAAAALKTLTPEMLRKMDAATVESLEQLKETISQAQRDRESLLAAR